MGFDRIHLEAKLPEQNIYRFFSILFGKNLFGSLHITVNNGRIGTQGRVKYFLFEEEQSFLKKLRQLLRKRLNAQKRIGCNYVVKDTTIDVQFIEELTKPKRPSPRAA